MKWTNLGVLVATCAMAQGLRADEVRTTLNTDAKARLSVEMLDQQAAKVEMSNPAALLDSAVIDDSVNTPPDASFTVQIGGNGPFDGGMNNGNGYFDGGMNNGDGYFDGSMHRSNDGRWSDGHHYYRNGQRYFFNGLWRWFFGGLWYSTPHHGGHRNVACFARDAYGDQFRAMASGYSAYYLQNRAVQKCRYNSPYPASCRAIGCR